MSTTATSLNHLFSWLKIAYLPTPVHKYISQKETVIYLAYYNSTLFNPDFIEVIPMSFIKYKKYFSKHMHKLEFRMSVLI